MKDLTKEKCKICGHDKDNHYLDHDNKIITCKDIQGKKQCFCRECEEYDAQYGTLERLK